MWDDGIVQGEKLIVRALMRKDSIQPRVFLLSCILVKKMEFLLAKLQPPHFIPCSTPDLPRVRQPQAADLHCTLGF